ncbi:MAG: PSD1 and planctomycete cytochrome C domain-containing protein [Planctomycetota bacterium]
MSPRPLRLALVLLGLVAARAAAQEVGDRRFEEEIRPILSEHCVACHDANDPESGLDLAHASGLRRGGLRGAALVPGDPDRSLLVLALRYHEPDLRMPPRGKLPPELITRVEAWVRDGAILPAAAPDGAAAADGEVFDLEARRREHWAWRELAETPPLPPNAHPVDALLDEARRALGIATAPRADRATLCRRLHVTLTGLPPTVDELDAFLSDHEPDAFARLVDRLLDSPHYGEHMARRWLDLAGYAETRGFEYDFPLPNAHHYRDYLARAFSADLPYDRLAVEHVAGDLLPEPRLDPATGADESVQGTAFWLFTEEPHAPVDPRQDQYDRLANRIDAFGKTFLGMTVACARCHDHKFDAISARDYYALQGFLVSSSYTQYRVDGRVANAEVARDLAAWRDREGAALAAVEARRILDAGAGFARALEEILAATASPGDTRPDLVVGDFDGDDWGGWTATGTAFGARPLRADERAGHRRYPGIDGAGVADSHQTRGGENSPRADDHVGTLTSPDFVIERPFLDLLVAGGAHADRTCVDVLVEGERVASFTGRNADRLEPRSLDLGPWLGKRARIVARDEHRGGWGHIVLDRVRQTDRPSAPGAERAARVRAARERARAAGLEEDAVAAAVEVLLRAGPGHPWRAGEAGSPGTPILAFGPEVPLRANGPVFGLATTPAGAFRFGEDPGRAVVGLATEDGAWTDPDFRGLELEPGFQAAPGIGWIQAGRTVRTDTVVLPEPGVVHYRVRGAGHVLAVVDGHRMINGPLHLETRLGWEDASDFRWVRHDLSRYVGRRVHFEFSPDDDSATFAVSRIVASAGAPTAPASDLAPAERVEESWRRGLAAIADGGRPAAEDLARTDWALRFLPRRAPTAAETERVATALAGRDGLRARIRRRSRVAPGLLDGNGIDEHVARRGSYKAPGERAVRRFLEAIDGPRDLDLGAGSGRLALARRLVSDEDPLFARVGANRIWQTAFGRGLVPTSDNLGALGLPPENPELLDLLARRFRDDGYSVKALLKLLVTSEAWARGDLDDPAARSADPTNATWWHRPPRRLDAEEIRDAVLLVSGRLDRSVGGDPVPIHLTDFMQGRGRPARSGPLDGEGRRSLYLSVRRNFPVPFLSVFDRPPPSEAKGRRSASNVPAQALALLNDPFVVAEARRWSERLESIPEAERTERAWREAFSRPPTPAERARVASWLDAEGDAGWSDLCHVLMNAKDFWYLR